MLICMESAKESHCSFDHSVGKLSRFIKNLQKPRNFSLLTVDYYTSEVLFENVHFYAKIQII